MYKIIGADGSQYGPVSSDQVRAWITEGRANGQTLAQPEGSADWKRLGELPEFADLLSRGVPPLTSAIPPGTSSAGNSGQAVAGPAMGLIVVGVVGLVMSVAGLVINLTGAATNLPGMDPNAREFVRVFAGTLGIISTIVSIILSGIILWGGAKMKQLENYALAITASVLAMIPCLSPCCLLGLPLGIWALVILLKPEVKAAFR
jgi:hypothetical protein